MTDVFAFCAVWLIFAGLRRHRLVRLHAGLGLLRFRLHRSQHLSAVGPMGLWDVAALRA